MIDGYRVLDAHIHVQPWEMLRPEVAEQMPVGEIARALTDPGAMVALLDAEGIEAAVLVNYVAPEVMGFTEDVNAWVASYCRGREDRLIAVGAVHPGRTRDPRGDVDRLADLGIRALKIHPPHMLVHANAYRRDAGRIPALEAIYARSQERALPVIVHTGTSIFHGARNAFADPMDLDDVAVDFPDLPLIMAHGGRPLYTDTAFFLMRRHARMRLDISSIPPSRLLDYFPRLEEIADRTVWGTDWPAPGVPSMSANVRAFLRLPLSDPARRRILSENAEALFRR